MRYLLTCLVVLVAVLPAMIIAAEQSRPAWMTDEVTAAALAIGLGPEQLQPFGTCVSEFLAEYGEAVRRLIRHNDPDLQFHIDRKRKSLARDMDAAMMEILNEEQRVPYQDYRRVLLAALSNI
ncbi:MAG: hypothetical protein O3A63_13480 [Proteobacteria bacterium]|nr:hypothetical protein [Pseudomonadota bacterium]